MRLLLAVLLSLLISLLLLVRLSTADDEDKGNLKLNADTLKKLLILGMVYKKCCKKKGCGKCLCLCKTGGPPMMCEQMQVMNQNQNQQCCCVCQPCGGGGGCCCCGGGGGGFMSVARLEYHLSPQEQFQPFIPSPPLLMKHPALTAAPHMITLNG